jgi:hypothetical protein
VVVAAQIGAQAHLAVPYFTRFLGGSGPVGVVPFARFYGLQVLLPPLYLYRPILPSPRCETANNRQGRL